MVADLSSTTTPPKPKPKPKPSSPSSKPKPAPLLSDNNGRNSRQKPKHVTSRYLSYTNSYSNAVDVTSSPVSNRRSVQVSATAKMLTKTSARSLSVSFQGESFALPVSKVEKPALERKKPPPRSRQATMSVDFTDEKTKLSGCDSDSESISSGSTLGNNNNNNNNIRGGTGPPRAIVVPARFWQETINLLRRVQPVPVDVLPTPALLKNNNNNNNKPVGKVMHDGTPKLQPQGSSADSYSKSNYNSLGNAASILSFSADSKRGKVGEKKLVDAHVLRVLHNKHMQWQFANAKAEAAMVVQRATAQKTLYNARVSISKLWHSVISKRLQMQQLKHNLKLHSLLKKQMLYLDNWDLTDRDYSISLAGAIAALESSSLCLPVLSGAKADILDLKDAICSAVDIMQAMAISLCSLVTKAESVNTMAFELANAMKAEYSLLDQCKDLLSNLTLLELQDCSLRAHASQLIPVAIMTQPYMIVPKKNVLFRTPRLAHAPIT
ncbi:QWRF motif-containing protein 2-like [Bidens hawaiensis]|uniref:QWRF motif-containing protein 2-like n=1 Tax=Bidens hawaiensis TaxID=980011 RepID=UPI004049EFEF